MGKTILRTDKKTGLQVELTREHLTGGIYTVTADILLPTDMQREDEWNRSPYPVRVSEPTGFYGYHLNPKSAHDRWGQGLQASMLTLFSRIRAETGLDVSAWDDTEISFDALKCEISRMLT